MNALDRLVGKRRGPRKQAKGAAFAAPLLHTRSMGEPSGLVRADVWGRFSLRSNPASRRRWCPTRFNSEEECRSSSDGSGKLFVFRNQG